MNKSPRVADFSTHLSGPIASRRLVALGADVIKIEHPKYGDGNRGFPPLFHGEGVHHLALNPGTRSLAVDPRSAEWPRVVAAVAKWADVVIVGNRPVNARRMGIDPVSLFARNPALVYCMITGYGLAGEWSELPAHGLQMDALAGAVPVAHDGTRLDVPAYFRSAGTTLAGIEAAAAIYAALHRRAHGEAGGQIVHVSIWESAMAWMWRDVGTFANVGRPWTAYKDLGSRYCVYTAGDGRALLVCPIERRFWERFCDVLGLPAELRARGDWSGGADNGDAYVALGAREAIGAKIATKPRDEWVAILGKAEIPVAPLLDWRESMASEHAAANGAIGHYEYRGRDVKVSTTPATITPIASLGDDLEAGLARAHRAKAELPRPPYLGEHNDELFRELGIRPDA